MIVHIKNSQSDLNIDTKQIVPIVSEVLKLEGVKTDEVGVHLVDADEICRLHDEYFDDPSLTDCISFPIENQDSLPYKILGDIFICPKTALNYAQSQKICPYNETTLYLVHSLLHLLGYDDIGEKEPEMRRAEEKHMKHLKNLNLRFKQP